MPALEEIDPTINPVRINPTPVAIPRVPARGARAARVDEEQRTLDQRMDPIQQPRRLGVNFDADDIQGFSFNPQVITIVRQSQFGGTSVESPHQHLQNFEILMETMKPK